MNLNISRITEVRDSYKPIADIVLELYKQEESYLPYILNKTKSKNGKLVFDNVNHKKMLHKYLVFEHLYIVLILALIGIGHLLVSLITGSQSAMSSYLMSSLFSVGGFYLIFKLLSKSEVPYRLVIDGLTIYELNHIGKRIRVFKPSIIESSDSEIYCNDFIFLCGEKRGKKKNFLGVPDKYLNSLIIMEGTDFEIRELLRKFFNDFSFVNSVKKRGQ